MAANSLADESPLVVSQYDGEIPLLEHLKILEDDSRQLSINDVMVNGAWASIQTDTPSFGMTKSNIWLSLTLTSGSEKLLPLYLHIDFPLLDEVDVFVFENETLINHFLSGESRPFSIRPVDYYGLVFPIIAKQGIVTRVFVKANNRGSMELPTSLWTQTAFLKSQLLVLLVWGALFSTFLVMTVYNGVLFYSTRDPVFGIFSLFCLSIFAYFFTLRGFSFQYLWPNSSNWEIASPLVFIATSTALFNLLVFYFLNLSKDRNVGRLFISLTYLNAATIPLLPFIEFPTVMFIQVILVIISAIAAIVTGIYRWNEQNEQERYAFLGLASCAVFAIYTTLGKLTFLGVSYFTDNGIAIAVTLTSILFSFILADRFRRLEQEKQAIQEQSLAYLKQYESIFESVSQGVFVFSQFGKLLRANPALCKMFHCETLDELKEHIEIKEKLSELPLFQSFMKTIQQTDRIVDCLVELPVTRNKTLWVEISSHHNQIDSSHWQIEGIVSDITQRRANETQLEYMANHDSLTNLLNRRAFERKLKLIIESQEINQTEGALIYLDLDQFKVINDVYGHSTGDIFLRRLANHIKSNLTNDQILARLGGDEFGVLSINTDIEGAKKLAQNLLESVQQFSFLLKDSLLTVGASIGLVVFDKRSKNLEVLLSRADAACYLAKDLGRNRMHLYSSADDDFRQRQIDMSWVQVIKESIANDRFKLYFQLIRPISAKEIGVSYEVLLRLEHHGKIIPPIDFLPASERYALMTQVDRWVIKTFFEFLSNHREHLEVLRKASINLSVQSLSDPEFNDFLELEFERFAIPHNKICFEVTETTAISNMETTLNFIKAYRSRDCQFAIDDFGTGFSSFAYLKQLPADYLKIDGLFVKNILSSDVDKSMVASICQVADQLNIRTVAEYVENKEVAQKLFEMGVTYGQGYYFDRPSPISELLCLNEKECLT